MSAIKRARRQRHCGRKVVYRTVDEARARARYLEEARIYDVMQPQAYRCNYASHYHVGHGRR